DQVQHPHRPSIVGKCAHEIIRPDVIGPLRPEPYARTVVEPQAAPWLLLLRNLQPFATPDSLHPVLADSPACRLQLHRDPAVAVAAILAGQGDDGLGGA